MLTQNLGFQALGPSKSDSACPKLYDRSIVHQILIFLTLFHIIFRYFEILKHVFLNFSILFERFRLREPHHDLRAEISYQNHGFEISVAFFLTIVMSV